MFIVVVAYRRAHTDLNSHHRSQESQRVFPFVAVSPDVFVRGTMFRLLSSMVAEADAVLLAGLAGGLLSAAYSGTRRGVSFGACIGALSAVVGLTRSVARSDARFMALESSLKAFGSDLSGMDRRFRALHAGSSDTSTRVSWMSEDARAAGKGV